jgi:hypothetical protein
MKSIILLLFLSLFFSDGKSGLTITKEKVLLSIDKNTLKDQLQEYRAKLWEEKKIRLSIERLDFTADQTIGYIKIRVDCGDGFKGSSGQPLLSDKDKVGFYRIYGKKDISPFGMQPTPDE